LSKGYVRVTARGGRTLTHVGEARAEQRVTLHFGDGAVDASVGDESGRPRPVERKRRRPYISAQPSLFGPQED
jgi:hypothetical protein